MRKLTFIFFVFFLFSQSCLFSFQNEKWLSPSGIAVGVSYRTLQPGEVIALKIEKQQGIEAAKVIFLGKEYRMGKDSQGLKLMAFIGLDISLQPGEYPIKIFLEDKNGLWQMFERKIVISPKQFPLIKLWVEQKYVTPPPEVRQRIKREAEILKTIYSMFSSQWWSDGAFIMPVSGRITAQFGERRVYNNQPRSSHSGLDIAASAGTPVRASNSGQVVLAAELYFSGKTVIINHGLGVFTIYCHFSKIRVKRGQQVRKGETIGEVGATGRVTGPHLHWGVKIFGSRVDPSALLSFR